MKIARRRQVGMVSNPLTYAELDAFQRLTQVSLTAWEVDLLMRLDDVALAARLDEKDAEPEIQTEKPLKELVPASNVAGVKALFRRMAGQQELRPARRR